MRLSASTGDREALQAQVRAALARGGLAEGLRARYPEAHEVRTDRALYDYVQALRAEYLRGAADSHYVFKELSELTSFLLPRHSLPQLPKLLVDDLSYR